jgi:translation elongation factor EF-G
VSEAPPPLLEIAIEPRFERDRDKLIEQLARLAAEDSTFGFALDRTSGRTIIGLSLV